MAAVVEGGITVGRGIGSPVSSSVPAPLAARPAAVLLVLEVELLMAQGSLRNSLLLPVGIEPPTSLFEMFFSAWETT